MPAQDMTERKASEQLFGHRRRQLVQAQSMGVGRWDGTSPRTHREREVILSSAECVARARFDGTPTDCAA